MKARLLAISIVHLLFCFTLFSQHPRLLFTPNDISALRNKWANAGSFPFSDFKADITHPKWDGSPGGEDYAGLDRSRAQFAKVLAFRYIMTLDIADGDKAYDYLDAIRNDSYLLDTRFDRWMVNGLALIDYCIAYDLLSGSGYFLSGSGGKCGTGGLLIQMAIAGKLKMRSNALYARTQNDRTIQQFNNDYSHTECESVSFLGLFTIFKYCYPVYDNNVLQDALFHGHVGNIRIMAAAALGVAAHSEIANTTEEQLWLQYSQKVIGHLLLNRNTYPPVTVNGATYTVQSQNVGGAFPEGIHYLNYAAEGFVPFFLANKINGGEDYTQDVEFRKILDWSYDVQLPSGSAPQLNSSGNTPVYPVSSLFSSSTPNGHNYLWQLQTFKQNGGGTVGMPVEAFCAINSPPSPSSKFLPKMMVKQTEGQVIYRDVSPVPSKYLMISAKNGPARYAANLHTHAEAGSFIFAQGNKLLVRHPGYSGHDQSAEYEKAISHSTVCPVVNNVIRYDETYRALGLPPNTDVAINNTASTSYFNYTNESFDMSANDDWGFSIYQGLALTSYAPSLTFAYANTAWMKSNAAKIGYGPVNRRFLMVNDSYLIVRDEITKVNSSLQYAVSLIQGNNGDNAQASYATNTGTTGNGDEVYWKVDGGSTPILRVNTAALGGKVSQFSGMAAASHQSQTSQAVSYHAMYRTACPLTNNYGQIISILESDASLTNKSSLVTKRNSDADTFLLYTVDGRNKPYGRYDVIFSQKSSQTRTLTISGLPNPIQTDAQFLVLSFSSNLNDVNALRIFSSNAAYVKYGAYVRIPTTSGDAQTSFQAPSVSVSISGPSHVYHPGKFDPPNTYTWTTSVSGGAVPYSYLWTKTVGTSTWQIGTGSAYSETLGFDGFSGGTSTATLTVNAADLFSNQGSASKSITVHHSGGGIEPKLNNFSELGIILPEEFGLLQNYPNPFNPETEITFALPEPSLVRLTVLDVLGREVAVLEGSYLSAGYKSARWNGRSANGEIVSSGMYFYRLTATGESGKNFVETKKMLMAK